ncbi:MAG TPA: AAA family ATPase [Gemmatimonadales bacterium]|nr:AAA family ATPase [Gemmatimonadales bacterium]
MLRTQIEDSATSAAKQYGHATVEPRHVLFAIVKRFRDHAELGKFLDRARQNLEPHGGSASAPKLNDEASALLATFNTDAEAISAALKAFKEGIPPAGEAAGGQARQSGAQAKLETAAQPATTTPATKESTADVLKELDSLIGMDAVKAQVRSVIAVVQANTERVKAGMVAVNPSLHLVFTGPPGTGKTTVARLVARLYASTGALPGSGFTEATRADLIAGYVGQTAIKTTEVINKTRPGVLFIDEAYSLSPMGNVDFGGEAIATLVKAMEDYRSELALIVAGYADEMAEFINSNPGLRSRFRTYINFPDYAAPELILIFRQFVETSGLKLGPGAMEKASAVFTEVSRRPNFGNARFARSLFEQAYARMAARAAADGVVDVSELHTLEPADIVLDADTLQRERARIGFHKSEE